MARTEQSQPVRYQHRETLTASELEYIAFSGQHETAHGIFRSIPKDDRYLYANKYILHEVIAAGIRKLGKFLAASAEGAAVNEKEFVDETIRLFISTSRDNNTYPRELFQSILTWCEELIRLSLLQEALKYHEELHTLGIRKYPDMYIKSLIAKASLLNTLGNFKDAQEILLSVATRPYVITERNLMANVLFDLGRESLLKGDVALYKELLFKGLRHFYTRMENRRLFVEQITKTYRRSFRVVLDRRLPFSDRALFLLHRCYFLMLEVPVLKMPIISNLVRLFLLGYVYCLNYGRRSVMYDSPEKGRTRNPLREENKNLLVTRAMGGIGDLLMMTPGFHQLKKKHPHDEIHLAIPKRYFPVFEGNPDVSLIDIEGEEFNSLRYRKWFNFTDCPASRVEARTTPRVKKGRIEIFARALGINPLSLWRMNKRPRYFVLPEERAYQINFWKSHGLEGKSVIGVQLRSDEVYRDYPHMRQLIASLARHHHVLVFDAEKINGLEDERIIKVDNLPMRRAFALASACSAIIAPDSSFVHLAAAVDIPCVALFGPIDGHVRTRHYPKCKYLDVKSKLGCTPCWRNDTIPCKLTNMRASVCMVDISTGDITSALAEVLQRKIP